jgi:hypothetical protein
VRGRGWQCHPQRCLGGRRGSPPKRWVFWGRQGAGGFAVDGGIIYGGAVGGDLKGLEKIGGEGVFVIRSAVLL